MFRSGPLPSASCAVARSCPASPDSFQLTACAGLMKSEDANKDAETATFATPAFPEKLLLGFNFIKLPSHEYYKFVKMLFLQYDEIRSYF
jgi:hypothetical protein